MTKDPIVEEVRKARAELFAKSGNDLRIFAKDLRKRQKESGRKSVRPVPSKPKAL